MVAGTKAESMASWETDPTECIINDGHFRIVEAGPLHAPVQKFSIFRDKKLHFVLKTTAASDAKSNAVEVPSGTVRISTERVELESVGGIKASLVGVIPRQVITGHDERGIAQIREEAKVHAIEGQMPGDESAAYSIDWLGNVSGHSFHWPDTIHTDITTTTERKLGRDGDAVELTASNTQVSAGNSAVKLTVAGVVFYLCATGSQSDDDPLKAGCIVYLGTPDYEYRKRVRNCLSFALGVYLVYLGNTEFAQDWSIVRFESVSAYSMDLKAFDLVNLPPAPLHKSWQFGIERDMLSRAVDALYARYDALKFGELSWAYWHALCATPHVAAVHFGAAIEALLRRYVEAHEDVFATKLISDRPAWKAFKAEVEKQIAALDISAENKALLIANLGSLNRTPHRVVMDRVLTHLGLRLGDAERNAWKRRDDAAHGNDAETGGELELIRDNKLLGILFHRLLLRMTNASDTYQDYFTLGHMIRRLEDPVPA